MTDTWIDTATDRIRDRIAYQVLLVAGITVLAAALRFYRLGQWSFWIDEIFTVNRAEIHFSNFLEVLQKLPATLWLPLSVALSKVSLDIFGVSEWSARLVPALIGIISIPILYLVARKFVGVGAALILVLLLAVSPWHLYWSQNARFYTSLMLLYTLAGLVFFFAIERDRPGLIILFYILLYFAMSERLLAAFLLPVALLYLGVVWVFRFERPPGFRRRNLLLFSAPLLLMALFELVRFLVTGTSTTTYFLQDFGGQQFDDPLRLFIAILFNLSLPIVTLALVGGFYLSIKKNRVGLFLLISALFPVLMLIILNPLMFTKDRYVFMTLASWFMLAALVIREIGSRIHGEGKLLAAGVLLIFLAQSAGANLLYYQVNNGNRLDWRTAFEIVREKGEPEDGVVAWWPEFGPFYLDREILPWKDVKVEDIRDSGRRYWFVLDYETFWANPQVKHFLEEQGELVEVLYLRQPEDNFFLRVYQYDPSPTISQETNRES